MITLEQFNKQYKYKSDLEKYGTSLFDVWEIPKIENGFYYGDCESYCRFLKENIEEFEDWDYYYCKLNSIGHCVLMYKGKIIDCHIQKVVSLETYKMMYNINNLKKYGVFVVLSKILVSYLFLLYKNLFAIIK